MSFTYDLTSDIGKLRFELADTQEDEFIFSDEELQYCLDKAENVIPWAIVFASEIKCRATSELTGLEIEAGDTRVRGGSSTGTSWCQMASDLRARLESGLAYEYKFSPFTYTGGIYLIDRRNNERSINDGTFVERDFYDYYNEAGIRGGMVSGNGENRDG
jgi:hypothetical protein